MAAVLMVTEEVWKPIAGYEGHYEVSNLGNVRGVNRTRRLVAKNGTEYLAKVRGVQIKPHYDSRGCYQIVGLNLCGKHKTRLVHRLVAETFIPNPDNLPEVNHIDEDKTNNAASNLEWCDHLYNNRYGTKLTASQGEKNAMNKFPEEVVRAIRSEYDPTKPGGRICELSRKYGVSQPHIRSIVSGRRWGVVGMTIICDSREKPRAITKILEEFDRQGVKYFVSKLFAGDYMNIENPMVIVDRKQNLNELCNNVVQDHKRFAAELSRAKEVGIHLVILCEHGHGIEELNDVMFWKNPRLKESPMAVSGERLFRILSTMQNNTERYDVEFQFCSKNETGKRIIQILGGDDHGSD